MFIYTRGDVFRKSKGSFCRDAVRHSSNISAGTELDLKRGISII